MTDGLLIIDKPSGPTSHDVVTVVRRATGMKVGHSGTLDPMATGVLVIGVGRATRLLRFVESTEKRYRAGIHFGVATDTLDAQGTILSEHPMPFDRDELESVMAGFRGSIDQVPPMFSALKIGGRRLHQLARAGEHAERPARQVEIFELDLVDFVPGAFPQATVDVLCSKGTYIRVLADDIGRALGGRAHLMRLTRTAVGSFDLTQAIGLAEIDRWTEVLLPPLAAVAHLDRVQVDRLHAAAVAAGRQIALAARNGMVALVDDHEGLLAVYRVEDGAAQAEVVLA
ncbi:MAG: tRNA pseudouridine(55) synthase TruB [Actinomycetota bacterium]